ncbi:MAG: gas vesicle protein [Bacteroidetes bacterium]|nr:gas vesicle protein [Bacteroidota bacterium]
MEPIRERHATLVDLLDRVLDKGVVLHADVIVSVAGIPLIGVTLRAALAGMETMLKYGLMEGWDESVRAWEYEQRNSLKKNLLEGQHVILDTIGAQFYEEGIYTAWRYGHFYLMDHALILYHKTYDEILLKIHLDHIKSMKVRTEATPSRDKCEILYILLDNGIVHRLRSPEISVLKNEITSLVSTNGVFSKNGVKIPEQEATIAAHLSASEDITHRGNLWHLCTDSAPGSIKNTTWRPGKLYLTNQRLCWEHQTDSNFLLDIPIDSITGCSEDDRHSSLFNQKTPIMDLIYEQDTAKHVASFSGKSVSEWYAAIKGVINQNGKQTEKNTESCPSCGEEAPVENLLNEGCPHCDWLSARMKRKAMGVPV